MFYPIFCSQGLNAITSWLPAQSSHIFNGYSDFHIFSMVSLSLHMFDGYTTFSHVLCCYTQCFPYFWWLYTMFPIFLMVWLFRIFIILCFVIPHFSNMPDGYTPCLQYFWCIYIYTYVYLYSHMFDGYAICFPIFLGYTTLSGIFDHNPSHMFELFPYFWWFYAVPPYIFDGYTHMAHMFDGYTTWLCPMVGSHPKVRQVLRRQPGAKLGGKSRLLNVVDGEKNT